MSTLLEGDRQLMLKFVRYNIDRLTEAVQDGYDIVCSCPTCGFMLIAKSIMLFIAAGIETGIKGAIKVNRLMRTDLPDIYAAGDCVETRHKILQDYTYLHPSAQQSLGSDTNSCPGVA